MIYSITRLPQEPIYIVRVKPPLHPLKMIYSIDMELLRITGRQGRRIYRVDDLTALQRHDFTLSDAYGWFCGDVREDALWRGCVMHVAVCRGDAEPLLARIYRSGEAVHVPLFDSVADAVQYSRLEIMRHNGHRR